MKPPRSTIQHWYEASLLAAFAILCLPGFAISAAEPTRVNVSRDVWISAYPSEQQGNNGGSHKLKLKGIQEFFLIDFDPEPLRGKSIDRAELVVCGEGETTLDRVTVSTVTTDWVEGTGINYEQASDGASFRFKSGNEPWSDRDGGDVTSVSLGRSGSKWCFGQVSARDADNWQRVPIDPEIVQARINDNSYGFLVMDDLGSEYTRRGNHFEYHLMPNRFLASREKNRSQAPYFLFWLSDGSKIAADSSSTPVSSGSTNQRNMIDVQESVAELLRLSTSSQSDRKPIVDPLIMDLDFHPIPPRDLNVARGETLSLVVAAPPENVRFGASADFDVSYYALPRVSRYFDPVVPIELWSDSNWKLGRESGAIYTCIDVYAKKSAVAGKKTMDLQIRDTHVPLEFTVWDFDLPDRLSFIPQMNCYGLPDNEIPFFRLCHDHRTTLNRLRYGWTGKVNSDAVPTRKADGTWDWAQWDQHFGPLLDGSAFADSRRGAIPIEAFYLPLNENWPMDHEKHFRGGYWVEDAYDEAYWIEFRQAVSDFCKHFLEQGYKDTLFEFYLNNKVYFKEQRNNRWDACSAPWVFDEPVNTQDFWALRRFGLEFWRGTQAGSGLRLGYRVDISRPQWQRDLLDGVSNVEVVSGSLRTYGERVIERARKFDNLVYMYGSANEFGTPNSTNAAWCVETWSRGGNGVVPWQTIGRDSSWSEPDPLSVIYPSSFGPIASLRLKSFRDGQQIVEYSEHFRHALGDVSAEELGKALLTELRLSGQSIKTSEADAGSVKFDQASTDRLKQLRYNLGNWLSERHTGQRQATTDLNPRFGVPADLREIIPVQLR